MIPFDLSVTKWDNAWMIRLDSANDDVGLVEVIEGEVVLGDGQVAVLEGTARNAGLEVGDAATSPVILALGEVGLDLHPGMTARAEIRAK